MKTNGLFIFYIGKPSKFGLQFYWPEVEIRRIDTFFRFYFSAGNTLVLTYAPKDNYYNFAFKLFGFGLGFDYAGKIK